MELSHLQHHLLPCKYTIITNKENKTQHKQQGKLVIFKTLNKNVTLTKINKFINPHTFSQRNQVSIKNCNSSLSF